MSSAYTAEEIAILRLSLVPGLGHRFTQALLTHFGDAERAVQASEAELQELPGIGPQRAETIYTGLQQADVDSELRLMEQFETHFIAIFHGDYPPRLKEITDPPHLLYVRGTVRDLQSPAVAIVGSRDCTSYGQKLAESFAQGLAGAGYPVVSGLALGIDGYAHRGCLLGGGRTVAVLAGGLKQITPTSHKPLGEEVIQHGGLVAETPMRMAPKPELFHSRNRIIAGMVQAVVVIEANPMSGSLITARHAAEQGRDVFVVPADVHRQTFAGSFELLRAGARFVRNVEDLLADLAGIDPPQRKTVAPTPKVIKAPAAQSMVPTGLDAMQLQLWERLSDTQTIDQLIQETGQPAADISRQLMTLEMKGVIQRLPGNQYRRK